jgi:hypothetical protein
MKLLRPKVEEKLSKLQVKLAWKDIEPAMASIDSITMLTKALTNTSSLVGQAVVRHTLEEVGVQPKHAAAVSAMLKKELARDTAKVKAVFNAAMPLVGGPVTMAKVGTMLEAVGVEKEQADVMLSMAVLPLLQRRVEGLGVQPAAHS